MAYYSAPFTFNFTTSVIGVDSGVDTVFCDALYDAIKLAQASEEGIIYGRIAKGSGLDTLGPGVQVGLTVQLLDAWQLAFAPGDYVANVQGGNLIGGPGGDPLAPAPGITIVNYLSAAATLVVVDAGGGSVPTAAQNAAAVLAAMNTTPPSVNIAKVNGYTVDGSGSQADPWGPV